MDLAWLTEAGEVSASIWRWIFSILITTYGIMYDFVEPFTESAWMGEIVGASGSIWDWISYLLTTGDQAFRAFFNMELAPFTPLNCALVLAVRLLCIAAAKRLEAYSLRWKDDGKDDPLLLRVDVDDVSGVYKIERKPRIPGTWPEVPPSPPNQAVRDPQPTPQTEMEALVAKHEEEKCEMWAIYIEAIEQREAENSRLKARVARERPRPTLVIDKTKNLPEVIQKRLGGVEGFVHNPRPVSKSDFSLRESIDVRREMISSNQALAASNYALVASNESLASSNQVLASKIEAYGKVQQDLVSQQFMANFNLIQTYRGKSTMRPVPEFFDVNKSTSQANVPSQTSNAHVDVAEVAQTSSKMIQVTKSTQTSDRTLLSLSPIVVSPMSTAPVMSSPANVNAVKFIEPTQNWIPEPVSLSSLVTSSPTSPVPTLQVEPEKTDSAKAELVLTTTKVTAPPASPLPLPSPLAALEKIVALPDSSVFSHSTLDEKESSVHASPNLNLPSKTIEKMPSPGTSATELDAAAVISIQPQPQPKIAKKLPSLLGELSSDNMFLVQAKRLKETPSLGTSPRVGNVFEAKLKDAIVKPTVVPPPSEVPVLPAPIPDVEPAPSTLTPPISQSPLAAVSVNSSAKINEVPKTEEFNEPVPVTSKVPKAAAVAVIATPVVIPGLPVNNNSDQPDSNMDWETDAQAKYQNAEPELEDEDDKMDEDSPLKLCSQSEFDDGSVSGSDQAPPTPSPAPRPNEPQPQQVLDEPMFDAPQIRPNRELEMDEAAVPSVDRPNVEFRHAPEAEMIDVPGSASSESKLREVPENKEREWSSPPVSPSVTRLSPPPEFVEVEKVSVNVSPQPELKMSREDVEEDRSSSSVSLPTQATSTPEAVEVDKVTVAAAPEPQTPKKPIRIKFVKKAANPLMTPVRPKKKTAAKGPDASPRSDANSPDALVVPAPDNWKSTAKADTGSKLVLLPVSSLKSVSQPRTDLPLNMAGSRKPSPLSKTIIEPKPDVTEQPEERSPSPIVTRAPESPAQSPKETATVMTTTEPESDVPGEPKDNSPSPTVPQTPEPPVPGTGLLATPSTIPGLSWPAPPPPMPSVTQQTLVLRDLSPEPEEVENESDDDSDSEVEFLGIDEYIPERKIMPLRRRRLALALGPAPTPEASTSEAPPSRSPTPESEALSELPSDSDDDQAMSEDEEPAPRKIAPLRRRRLGDEQTQRAQAQEHEFRKKKLQEEQKELDEKAAKFQAPPPFPMVPAPFVVRTTPLKFNPLPAPNSSSEPSPASKLSPALLAVAPSLAGLVVVIGSPEVEDELKKSLEPLWDLIDADQLKTYGPKSLTQLAIRRWGELMERKRYNKGQSIFRSMFDDLIDKWAELVVTETFVAHLIVPNDDESQAEIMDPWLEKIREARKK
ncbi:hypothetical protein JMJ77_0004295 [Colletotrichum scovillei]|uniref:Uncharacterized protein n=1 Tax=Colletotrichum scovillei TaxID=1209932 RepID=A0A9P7QZ25_9PEZI|nr:hypothetical protein JMJ77_0004295 [Colletotrichum scovillei]KAG7049548.1 hypothetical protein JMJ78_0013529 [Colletotrichum scovillei]KAG7064288.1 hypothetical protein JMJ76_0007334 [Colletotrichum scovillei]